MKLPKKSQWKRFFKVLNKFEKIIFSFFFFLFIFSSSFLATDFYFKNTKISPKEGGEYIEGVLGTPRWINPLFSSLNDVDSDLVELLFAGVLKYEENELKEDLAEKVELIDGKTYLVTLKNNLFWSDGKKITIEDLIFTVEAIKNSETKSPLRSAWLNVNYEIIDERTLKFLLKEESATFLENLTLKIIPKHIWQEIPFKDFSISIRNLKPVSSGPFKIEKINFDKEGKISSISLIKNEYFFGKKPYLQKITFKFFEKKEDLIESFRKKEIMGFYLPSEKYFNEFSNFYSFPSPRYFSVFFNIKDSKILNSKKIRKALAFAINKEEILKEILKNVKIIQSPLLPEIYNLDHTEKIYSFDPEKAKSLLDEEGFKEVEGKRMKIIKTEEGFQFKSNLKLGSQGKEVEELQKCLAKIENVYPEKEITGYFGPKTREAVIRFQEKFKDEILKPFGLERGTGEVKEETRKKLNEICFIQKEERIPLKLSLTVLDEEIFLKIGQKLKECWETFGIEIDIKAFKLDQLLDKITKRDYEILIFGEALNKILDPFPFWHSSQIREPGLNLSLYENKEVDKILEETRKTLKEEERKEKFEKLQEILTEDCPAIFLFRGDYFYFVSEKIKGIKEKTIFQASQRFLGIENWYIKEKRVWK